LCDLGAHAHANGRYKRQPAYPLGGAVVTQGGPLAFAAH